MCCYGISNVPELLWWSLCLKVSRGFQKGGKAKRDVAIVLNKALSKSQLPSRGALPLEKERKKKIIIWSSRVHFPFAVPLQGQLTLMGVVYTSPEQNRPLQEDLVSSFWLWFSFRVAKFYGLARMLTNMEKQSWLLPYQSAYFMNFNESGLRMNWWDHL